MTKKIEFLLTFVAFSIISSKCLRIHRAVHYLETQAYIFIRGNIYLNEFCKLIESLIMEVLNENEYFLRNIAGNARLLIQKCG